jgi:hypothetical protein
MGSVLDWSGIRKICISNDIQCKCVLSGCTNFKYFDFSTLDLYIWPLPFNMFVVNAPEYKLAIITLLVHAENVVNCGINVSHSFKGE